jgi:hypothetical protein
MKRAALYATWAAAEAKAARKTRHHHRSVLSAIPCCWPNARSVKPRCCQCSNTSRICRARTIVVEPMRPIDSYLCIKFCTIGRSSGEMYLVTPLRKIRRNPYAY